MAEITNTDLPVPEQKEGTQKDILDSVTFSDTQEARQFYLTAKSRLLDVNNWSNLCGKSSAKFALTNEKGDHSTAVCPEINFHFKIDIPGPGTTSGEGYDWVQVEAIDEVVDLNADTEYIIIRVRPATDPTTPDSGTAHFFSSKATSNFLVLREHKVVTAAVLGRNELANTKESTGLLDTIRNFLVGNSARLGIADPQWESLVKGILQQCD